MSVLIGELNWREYQGRVRDGGTPVFLPLGALEQHGPHMSMNVDVLLPTSMSELVARQVGGLVAPPITYGYKSQVKSGGGNHMPGTTSLDGATLIQVVRNLLCEFARHGVRKIVAMNGHFENSMFLTEGVDLALRDLRRDGVRDMRVMMLSYWDFIGDAHIPRLYPESFPGWDLEHGGVLETSMMLCWHPGLVDMGAVEDHPPASFPPYDLLPPDRSWTPPSGTLSSPKDASREKGELIIEIAGNGIRDAVIAEFGRGPRAAEGAPPPAEAPGAATDNHHKGEER